VNWLAHLRLAPAAPLVRLGNLAGDFVRGVDTSSLHPDLRRGIEQHRAIDRFVDAHRVHRRGRARFGAPWRRFGGVALDVFFDHFLARDWAELGDGVALDAFIDRVHLQLEEHQQLLPPALARAYVRMQEHGWLRMYASIEGVDEVLGAMARRSRRAKPLADAAAELRRNYDAFDADFAELWPELAAFAGVTAQ
jgi:acyl carrier protein phosphodiesterase